MKYTFLSVALATALYTSAQTTTIQSNQLSDANRSAAERLDLANQRLNRATEWSKETSLEGKKIDTSKLVKKTISQEINLPKALDVLIDMSGELIIHTWKENKMKIETTIQYEEPNVYTDSQWFEKTGVSMKAFGSTVKVKSRPSMGFGYISSAATSYSISAANYYIGNTNMLMQRGPVTLYIPAESILEIESKSGRLRITDNIKSLLLDNTDGQIEFANIEKLQVRSIRGSFSGGIVTEGDVELSHGRFSLKQLNKGTIKSDYSTIEIEAIKELKLNSSNDEMDIDNVASLNGNKNYGNLRINQLTGKLDLQGINSDIKLRHIDPSTQLVKISNRNADLRLSTDRVSNYTIDIKGSYNTVYTFASENLSIDTLTNAEIETVKSLTATPAPPVRTVNVGTYNTFSNINSNGAVSITTNPSVISGAVMGAPIKTPWLKQSAKSGTGTNATKYEVTCISCVIDFK